MICSNPSAHLAMGRIWVVIAFIAAGQYAQAGELLNHLKRSSRSCSMEKENDVAKLPPRLPVAQKNSVFVPVVVGEVVGDGTIAVKQGNPGLITTNFSPVTNKQINKPLAENNAVPLTSSKEEHAARNYPLLPPSTEVNNYEEDNAEVNHKKEPVSTRRRITAYNSNVLPQMIIVYHHHHKKRSASRL